MAFAQTTRTQPPRLARREERVVKEIMPFAGRRVEHTPQTEQMAINTAPSRRLARQARMRLHRATEERLAQLRLSARSVAGAVAARRGWAYRAVGVDHGEDEGTTVGGERADSLRPAVLEETR